MDDVVTAKRLLRKAINLSGQQITNEDVEVQSALIVTKLGMNDHGNTCLECSGTTGIARWDRRVTIVLEYYGEILGITSDLFGRRKQRKECKDYSKCHEHATAVQNCNPEEFTDECTAVEVLQAEWYRNSKRISMYMSTAREVITDAIVTYSLESGKEVYIPYFEKACKSMDMLRLKNNVALTTTLYGVRQHPSRQNEESFIHHGPLDLVIVPGVAFTKDGRRLGHGKGYYDRFFNEHAKIWNSVPQSVGLALKHQLLDDLPTDANDYKLDSVFTCD